MNLVIAQQGIENQYYENIIDLYKIDEKGYIIIQHESKYAVKIIDEDGNLVNQFLRNGDGPGEARKIEASFFDKKTGYIYLKDSDGSILVYDVEGSLLSEKIIGRGSISSIDVLENTILLGSKLFVSQDLISKEAKVKVATLINKDSYEELEQISITIGDLGIDRIADINKVRGLMLDTNISFIDEETVMATFNGIPSIFIFRNGKLISKESLQKFNDLMINVTKHQVYGYGIKIPAINNNLQKIDDDLFLLTYGNTHQSIPFGYFLIEAKNPKESILPHISVLEDIEIKNSFNLNTFRMKFYQDRYFIFDGITRFANEIFIQ